MQTTASIPTKQISSWYPWVIWVLGACFFFYKNLLMVSPGVMSNELMAAFSVGAGGLGGLSAIYFDTYLLMQVPGGMLLDRFGLRAITAIAILVCAASAILFANASSLVTASIARGLIGLAAALAPISCFKLVALWFPSNRFALLGGASLAIGMIGAVFGNAPLAALVGHFGWREALTIVSIPGFLLALLYWIYVRDKAHVTSEPVLTLQGFFQELWLVIRSKQTWLLCVFSGLAYAPLSAFGGLWGVPFLTQAEGYSSTTAATFVSFVFIGFALGAPLAGWYSDLIGRRIVVSVIGTTTALIALTTVIFVHHLPAGLLIALLFIFGFGSGCYFLCFAMIRELNSLALAATVIGFMNTFDTIMEAFTHPLIGVVLDKYWSGQMLQGSRVFSLNDYHAALFILPAYLVLGLILLIFVKETYCQQQK